MTNVRTQVHIDRRWLRNLALLVFTVGFLIEAWTTYKPGEHWSGFTRWIVSCILVGFETAGYFAVFLVILGEARAWLATLRLLGMPSRDSLRASYLASRPMQQRTVWHGLGVVFVLALFAALGQLLSLRFLVFGAVCVSVTQLYFLSTIVRPATGLFLSGSSLDAIALHANLKRSRISLRVIALLDMDRVLDTSRVDHEWMSMIIGPDCLRTSDQDVWQYVIELLIRHVPLIVLDARSTSQAVVHEATRLSNTGNFYKTLFVTGVDGHAPVLDFLSTSENAEITVAVVAEQQIAAVFWFLARTRNHLPTPTKSIASLTADLAMPDGKRIVQARRIAHGDTPVQSQSAVNLEAPYNEAVVALRQVKRPQQPRYRECPKCRCVSDFDEGSQFCLRCDQLSSWKVLVALGGMLMLVVALLGLVPSRWQPALGGSRLWKFGAGLTPWVLFSLGLVADIRRRELAGLFIVWLCGLLFGFVALAIPDAWATWAGLAAFAFGHFFVLAAVAFVIESRSARRVAPGNSSAWPSGRVERKGVVPRGPR